MILSHRGATAMVKEGHDDRVMISFNKHDEEFEGKMKDKFPAACRYAMKWLLENAGGMKGNYER